MASRIMMAVALALAARAEMPVPRYTAAGELIRPEGYREWMFVGSNLNMGYQEPAAAAAPKTSTFHNIYIQREAYKQYERTGKFPDKTMLVMEVVAAGTNASINKQGQFGDRFVGIEVALKDEGRFAEKWAYFDMIGKASAPAFAKDRCWSCHNQHGSDDNVFVQFYPVLRAARPKP
ncbi:MAG: cytochrome P460 family protein [Bryobacteraceae bacterium]